MRENSKLSCNANGSQLASVLTTRPRAPRAPRAPSVFQTLLETAFSLLSPPRQSMTDDPRTRGCSQASAVCTVFSWFSIHASRGLGRSGLSGLNADDCN